METVTEQSRATKTREYEERKERKENRNRILRGTDFPSFVRGKLEQFPGRCAPMRRRSGIRVNGMFKKVGKKRIFSVRIGRRSCGQVVDTEF